MRQPGVRNWDRVDRELDRKKIAAVYRIGPCTSDEVGGERQIFWRQEANNGARVLLEPPPATQKNQEITSNLKKNDYRI